MPGGSRKQRMHSRDREHKTQKRNRSVSPSEPKVTRKRFKHSSSQQEDPDTQTELRILKLKVDFLTAKVNLLQYQLHNAHSQTNEMEEAHKKSYCILM